MNNAKRNNKFAFMRIRTRCVDRARRHQLLFPLRASFGFVQVIYQKAFDTVYIVYYTRHQAHEKDSCEAFTFKLHKSNAAADSRSAASQSGDAFVCGARARVIYNGWRAFYGIRRKH